MPAWSWKFCPTPGRCCTTGMPKERSADWSPIPKCMSTLGVLIAP